MRDQASFALWQEIVRKKFGIRHTLLQKTSGTAGPSTGEHLVLACAMLCPVQRSQTVYYIYLPPYHQKQGYPIKVVGHFL